MSENLKDVEFAAEATRYGINVVADGLTFGTAFNCMKTGSFISRKGWDGKGMFVWMLPAQELQMEWLHDPVKLALAKANGGTVKANATFCLYNTRHEIETGWVPSICDICADDWLVVNPVVNGGYIQ